MTPLLPDSLIRSIAHVVQRAGGDLDDAQGVVDVWKSLDADLDRAAAQLMFDRQNGQGQQKGQGQQRLDGWPDQ